MTGAVLQDLPAACPGPACYLEVVLWVPVRIKDDASVSSGKVDAQPTCPRAQEKDEAIRVGLAEAVDGSLAQVPTHPPINALIGVPAPRGEEVRAGSQQGLNWLRLTNPFLLLPPGCVWACRQLGLTGRTCAQVEALAPSACVHCSCSQKSFLL